MKNKVLTALFLFVCITTWAQQVTPIKPFNLPDCNLPAIPFRNEATSVYQVHAAHLYAMLMNTAGAAVAITDSAALASVNDALSSGNEMQVTGYVAGVSVTREGKPCISFSEKLSTVTAVPWFRWDKTWMIFLRTGCRNPVLVYAPSDDKGVDENPPVAGTPNLLVYAPTYIYAYAPEYHFHFEQPAEQSKQCCPKDKRGETEFDVYFLARRVQGNILLPQGGEVGFGMQTVSRKLYKNEDGSLFGKPFGVKARVEIFRAGKIQNSVKPPCDTCGNWVPYSDDNGKETKIDIAGGVTLLGWKPFAEVGWLSLRGDLLAAYETPLAKNQNAGWTGFSIEAGLQLLIGQPDKIHVELSAQEDWFPFPTAPAEFGPGAFNTTLEVKGMVPFEVIKKEAKSIQRKNAKHKAEKKQQKEAEYQSMVAQPLLIDTALYAAQPVDTTLSKSEQKKVVELNKQKEKVFKLLVENNRLQSEISAGNDSLRKSFESNRGKLDAEQKKLERMKKKVK